MNSHTIEIFVEPDCSSCSRVISLVTSFTKKRNLYLRIFDRQRNADEFLERMVVVCPATFVNNRLAFYGEFTEEALNNHIRL
jgi:Thioredoxin domain